MEPGRRHRGWRALSIVAAVFAAGLVVNVVVAIFARQYLYLLTAAVWLVFWYWIGMGAHRRAVLRGTPPE